MIWPDGSLHWLAIFGAMHAAAEGPGRIAGIVNGGMIDYLRGISEHVSIGVAFKDGQSRHQWFALVRQDPT